MTLEVLPAQAGPSAEAEEEATFTLEDDKQLLRDLNAKVYKAQAVWFLNAFWKQLFAEDSAAQEAVWEAYNQCVDLDARKEAGTQLDQMTSHRLLEKIDKALTAHELRACMADIDLDKSKSMSLCEFLVFKFKVDWRALVHGPQGQVDDAKLALAENKVAEAKEAIEQAELSASEARQALKESVEAEMTAKAGAEAAAASKAEAEASEQRSASAAAEAAASEAKALEEESEAFQSETLAKSAEAKATAAREEQEAVQVQVNEAMAAIEREQEALQARLDALEATGNDESLGIVKRNTAKAQLAQLKCSDPMPLQRANISHSAVVRRQERMTKSATAAQMAAQQARAAAEASREGAVKQREQAEQERGNATAALRQAEQRKAEAVAAHDAAEESQRLSEEATRHSEKFKQEAEAAVQHSVAAFQSATRFLAKTKAECAGAGKGKLWWMSRELEESKKYMSKAQLARLAAAPPLDADVSAISA